ncbi:probable metal-nicotianamine transporter YSL7 [Tanacetum coccineum]|uniref:Probable metal-nicotianamine transporter YSL7 n=1 Tax=Tanacetum coccineum TaxID=301880 RepID=A0ABQ5FYM8_9ASTR
MMNMVATASDLMQDFKTGYLTMASPRSMFVNQVIGTAMGKSGIEYPVPYVVVYRNLAILGVEGFGALPNHCLSICYGFFAAAILINVAKETGHSAQEVGTVHSDSNGDEAAAFGPTVASGLICGEGLWSVPKSILAIAKIYPLICMKVLSRRTNVNVDTFIATLAHTFTVSKSVRLPAVGKYSWDRLVLHFVKQIAHPVAASDSLADQVTFGRVSRIRLLRVAADPCCCCIGMRVGLSLAVVVVDDIVFKSIVEVIQFKLIGTTVKDSIAVRMWKRDERYLAEELIKAFTVERII